MRRHGHRADCEATRPPISLYSQLGALRCFLLLSSLYLLFILLPQRVMIHGRAAEQSGDEVMDRW